MACRRLLGGLTLGLLLNIAIAAEPPTTAVIGTPPQAAWAQLSAQQKVILAPLAKEWDSLENIRKKKWLAIAERYPAMKQDDQQRMQDRMREWAGLSPLERSKVRDTYKDFKQLPAEQNKWSSKNGRPIRTCRPKNASASASQASHRSYCHPQALLRTHRALKRPLVSHRHRRRSTRVSSADEQ